MAESLNNTIPLTCSFVHPEKMWNPPLYTAGLEKKNMLLITYEGTSEKAYINFLCNISAPF